MVTTRTGHRPASNDKASLTLTVTSFCHQQTLGLLTPGSGLLALSLHSDLVIYLED